MSERTEKIRKEFTPSTSPCGMTEKGCVHFHSRVLSLLDDYERLEADLDINTMKIRQLQAEHERICNEHALLVQESGREGRELDRLEGLLRAWAADGWVEGEGTRALWAEAVRLARTTS